jgi:hypothetical protein
VTDDDFYGSVDGIRQPDPTLGKKPLPSETQRPAVALSTPSEPAAKPRRQRVVLAAPRRMSSASMRARVELAEQTSWGKLLVKDLVKVQLRAGLLLFGLVVVVLGALPVLFHQWSELAAWRVIGIPVPWIALGILPFPLLFAVGMWYNRLAERHEQDFVAMIEN